MVNFEIQKKSNRQQRCWDIMIHHDTLGENKPYNTLVVWAIKGVIVPLVRGIISAHYGIPPSTNQYNEGPWKERCIWDLCQENRLRLSRWCCVFFHGGCYRLKPDGSSFVTKSLFLSFPELFATTNSVLILHGPVFMAATWQMTGPKRPSIFLVVDWKLSFHEWVSHVFVIQLEIYRGCINVYIYTMQVYTCLYHFIDLSKRIPHDDRIHLGYIYR